MVLPQVDLGPGRAELGVLVREDLGEARGGGDDDPGVPVERAIGRAALGALVDVAGDGGDPVGGLVVLLDLAFGGELDRADDDGRAVGVELPEALGGGDDSGVVEPVLKGLLEVEHGVIVGDLDLDGERGRSAGDDRSVHGFQPPRVKAGSYRKAWDGATSFLDQTPRWGDARTARAFTIRSIVADSRGPRGARV